MHGWYSAKQAKVAGVVLYSTPDGGQVEVTMVSKTQEHTARWDDISYIGEVVYFIRKVTPGDTDGMEEDTPENRRRLAELIERELAEEKTPKPYRWN